jgi:hypothetical protein
MTDITIAASAIEPATSKKDTSCEIKYKLLRLRICRPNCSGNRVGHLATPRIVQSQANHGSGTRGISRESKPLAVGIILKG